MNPESPIEELSGGELKNGQRETASANTEANESSKEVLENQPGQDKNADSNKSSENKEAVSDKESKNKISENYAKQFEDAELWEQIRNHTKKIEIDEDANFYWPERRKHTEEVIQQLITKRILFIRSASEDWSFPAVQRLASVLQSGGKLLNLLLRISKSNFSFDSLVKEKLEFGFWKNQRRLPYPVVIFISYDNQDFIQKFLNLDKQTIQNDVLADLKKANLYIVCQVDNNSSYLELFARYKRRVTETFAIWDVPCIKLHITKHLNSKSEILFRQLEEKGLIKKYGENNIYEALFGIETEPEVIDSLCEKLKEIDSDIEVKKNRLISIMHTGDFVSQVVVFCGAFFNGLYYPDFFNLVKTLLSDEKNEPDKSMYTPGNNGFFIKSAEPQLLSDVWEKNADKILKACLLETKKDSGNNKVGFVIPGLAEIMTNHIEENQYPFFYRVYQNFEKVELLINPGLNKNLEKSVIQFFATASRMDTSTHNATWLANVVYDLWKLYEPDLPVIKDYDELLRYLWRGREIATIVFNRIPLMIGELLRNSNQHFREVIKEVFRLLLNRPDAKKMAVIIASYLYKEFRSTNTFSADDLVSYFRRTLDEGNWEDSFFAYDALTESMNYRELYEQAKNWIDDDKIADSTWTKQFAFLYQVDFILVTVYRYFRQFKGEVPYELWESSDKENYPDTFRSIVKDLLSERCIKGLAAIFNSDTGYSRFIYFTGLFEAAESGKILKIEERFETGNNESYALVADLLETWFYILVHKHENLRQDSYIEDKWKAFALMIIDYCDIRFLRIIRKQWVNKLKTYTAEIENNRIGLTAAKRKTDTYEEQLKKRRNSLKMLVFLIQEFKMQIQ